MSVYDGLLAEIHKLQALEQEQAEPWEGVVCPSCGTDQDGFDAQDGCSSCGQGR